MFDTACTPPAELADFVRARDVRYRFPTCAQPAATADLDHTIPYPDGLKTHAPGWDVERHPDGRITWTTAIGRVETSHSYDYRPDRHPPPGDDPPLF